eukprot:4765652-Pyramimonas_sp.AAC.1
MLSAKVGIRGREVEARGLGDEAGKRRALAAPLWRRLAPPATPPPARGSAPAARAPPPAAPPR